MSYNAPEKAQIPSVQRQNLLIGLNSEVHWSILGWATMQEYRNKYRENEKAKLVSRNVI